MQRIMAAWSAAALVLSLWLGVAAPGPDAAQASCVGGKVFDDPAATGTYTGQAGINGVRVDLYTAGNVLQDWDITHTVEDEAGAYGFCSLTAGQSYRVAVVVPPQYLASTATSYTFESLADGVERHFGLYAAPTPPTPTPRAWLPLLAH